MEEFEYGLRGTAAELSEMQIGLVLTQMIYPAVLNYCYQQLGEQGAIKILFKLGELIMDEYLKHKILLWKNKKFADYIKDWLQFYYHSKAEVKKIDDNLYHVIDKKCILCTDIEVEGLPFHYCVPYAGSIERMLNVLSENGKITLATYKVETITSRGNGDPACTHAITVLGGE